MLGLCFDYRVMNSERGFFFVPGVSLGIVYSAFQVALMKAKLPQHMHRDVITYNSRRWSAPELLASHAVDRVAVGHEVSSNAQDLAQALTRSGAGVAHQRAARGRIKRLLYEPVLEALAHGDSGLMDLGGRPAGEAYAPPPRRSNL